MRVLITGASGNLGRRLADRLEGRADIWRAFRTPRRSGDRVERTLTFDLTDAEATARAVAAARPDRVYHLAAFVDVQRSIADPARPYRTNLLGTLHLLEALRSQNLAPRFLYISTAQVYGAPRMPADGRIAESSPPAPVNPYAASKRATEELLALYGRLHGVEGIVLRPFNLIGPGQPPTSVCSALARRVLAIASGECEPPLRVGNLDSVRDFVVVDDALEGIMQAMELGRPGETYNLCTGRGTPVRDILDQLLILAEREIAIETDPDLVRPVDPPRIVGDPEKLARDTGFRAERPFKPALKALYREMGCATTHLAHS